MNEELPDGFEMTELGPLPQGGAVVRLLEAEEERAEADREFAQVLQHLGLGGLYEPHELARE